MLFKEHGTVVKLNSKALFRLISENQKQPYFGGSVVQMLLLRVICFVQNVANFFCIFFVANIYSRKPRGRNFLFLNVVKYDIILKSRVLNI